MAKTLDQHRADVKRLHPEWSQTQIDIEASRLYGIETGTSTSKTGNSPLDTLQGKLSGTAAVGGQVFVGTGKGKPTSINIPSGGSYVTYGDTESEADLKTKYYSDPKFERNWMNILKKNGFGDAASDPIKAAAMFDIAVSGAADWYQYSNGQRKVTPEQYISWWAKGEGLGQPSVSVQKYLYQPEQIQEVIEDTLKTTLRRKPTEQESKEFYTSIKKLIDEGTVTTTKKVGGKTVSTTTPGYTAEKARALITEKIKAESPQDYQEAKSLEFADFLGKLKG